MRISGLHAMLVAVIGVACSDDTTAPTVTWIATINVANETPAPTGTTDLGGTATITISGGGTAAATITYSLALTGTPTSTITAAHIHTAAAGATGTIRVNLCGTSAVTADATHPGSQPATPTCPQSGGNVSGQIVNYTSGSTYALGCTLNTAGTACASNQLTFDQLVTALRGYGAYVNVHTTTNGGGEARGQLLPPALP